jgi:hypothetical protein
VESLLAWLYPNRGPVAIAVVAVVAVLAVVGWRRGWDRVARRHPRATAMGLLAVLAVGLPMAWYLGSPLLIRTELVEPAPIADAARPSAAPAASAVASSSPRTTPEPSSSPAASGGLVLEGAFVGADDFHFARGTARLLETAGGEWDLRLEDFSVRNGPDLFVYLSPDPAGYAEGAIELGTLKATDGSFNYDVPSDVDVDGIRSVVIWCKAFSVQFGAATLTG